jgi:beta-N-acetylhexosaminidase
LRIGSPALAAQTAHHSRGALAASATSAEDAWIHLMMSSMTTQEKVGQLFEINGYGESVRDPNPAMVALNREYYGVDNIAQLIAKYHPGGIIYFDWANKLQDPSQILGLSNGIQKVALSQPAPIPMVISTDQEMGEVLRISSPATVFPGNMPVGATRSASLARQAGAITGVELRAMGINVDNAPVVDNNIQPLNQADGIRAYGDQVPLVSGLGVAQVRGYQTDQGSTGVGATLKHWPGFGDSEINSDNGVATSPETLGQVMRFNVPSFRAAISAGADRVMVTHILFPKITGTKIPTSLSPFWVNGLLRGNLHLRGALHYNGPVVTDALDAAALNGFTPAQVALDALQAGDDELLEVAQEPTDHPPADLVSAYSAVLTAVQTGSLSMQRLDQSVIRILKLKWKLGLVSHPLTNPAGLKVVGTPQHLAVADRVGDTSITLLRNRAGLLPLRAAAYARVLVTGFGQTATATIAQALAEHGVSANPLSTGFDPDATTITHAVSSASRYGLIIVTTFNAWSAPGQIKLVDALLATGKPVIVAATGTPYDVAYFPKASTFVTSYGYLPVSLKPMVEVLFGALQPTGRLPVTITAPPPSTKVLYPFGFRLSLSP